VNNLKDVSVEIAKRRLTVFTGVSGFGEEFFGVLDDRGGAAAVHR
jgi:excinuclease UvrABC ATPase subunit